MTEKEIREIRRRFRPDKSMLSGICGCYINEAKNIITTFRESLAVMPQEESERFLGLLKKTISGSLGKNLVNLEFIASQVMQSEEYKLLAMLRQTGLNDDGILHTFYERVAETLNMEGSYIILLTHDDYGVPYRSKDGGKDMDASDEVFSYIVCSICPVKLSAAELSFELADSSFRALPQDTVLSAPKLGFMFPLFDDRAANIYGALYYTKSLEDNHEEFIESVFNVEPPMPADVQKETFQTILADALEDECSLETVQTVHEQLSDMIDRHKENKEPDQLLITRRDIDTVLQECGVSDERKTAFAASFDEMFGEDAELPPANVIDKKQFVITTPDAVIKVNPERSDLIEMRKINGISYILIPADSGVEVNGVSVSLADKDAESL